MNDPYKVLNVSRNATEDEIKKAYREQAKKYHPDRYQNSPLADVASEKMKEINQAYDQIMNERKNGGSAASDRYYDPDYRTSDTYYGYNSFYSEIRRLINSGQSEEAEQRLNSVLPNERNAEWYYLKAVLFYRKGWLEDAFNYSGNACKMDPQNVEYRSFHERVTTQRSGAVGGYQPSSSSGCCDSFCDSLACLLCCDCLGELLCNH